MAQEAGQDMLATGVQLYMEEQRYELGLKLRLLRTTVFPLWIKKSLSHG